MMSTVDVAHLLERAGQEYDSDVALVEAHSGRSLSFRELVDSGKRLATGFLGLGLVPGDRVGVLLTNRLEWVEVSAALCMAELVQVLLPTTLDSSDVAQRLSMVGARAVVLDRATASQCSDALRGFDLIVVDDGEHQPQPDSLSALRASPTHQLSDSLAEKNFCIRFTSGSTGRPKGVLHTQTQYAAVISNQLHARNWGSYFGRDDVFLQFLPVESALQFLYSCLVGGVTTVLLDVEQQSVAEAATTYGVTMTFGAPPILAQLLDLSGSPSKRSPSTLRTVFYGGAPMSPALEQSLQQNFGLIFVHIYAASEFPGCTLTRRRGESASNGSCGLPGFGVRARVVLADDGTIAEPGVVGDLEIYGDHVFAGYWADQAATHAVFQSPGWARVGDLAFVDDTGSFSIVDRSQNLIIVDGETVYPSILEGKLSQLDALLEVAVLPFEKDGTATVMAVCYLDRTAGDGRRATIDAIERVLIDNIPSAQLIMRDEPLPKSPVGKVLRTRLVDDLSPGQPPGWPGHRRRGDAP